MIKIYSISDFRDQEVPDSIFDWEQAQACPILK